MTRENWLWMRASVSLIAATVAAMRLAVREAESAEKTPQAPEPDAAPS
ncbi:MAG TPA: hypothetical protein VEU32_16470 [Burkholderiales bacterium]|nr:hypothetical protein [Burkholderiales bacterium]